MKDFAKKIIASTIFYQLIAVLFVAGIVWAIAPVQQVAACTCPGYAVNNDTTCGGSNACGVGYECTIACMTPACSGCTPKIVTPPPPPGTPPPSGWGACGSCNCGTGNSPAECRTCPTGCCWDPTGCAVPSCVKTMPAEAVLISPANNADVVASNGGDVNFTFSYGSWRTGCPNTNLGYFMYGIKTKASCDFTQLNYGYFMNDTLSSTTRPVQPSPAYSDAYLHIGNTYCWTIRQENGSGLYSYAPLRQFRVIPAAEVLSAGLAAPTKCFNQKVIGSAAYTTTNNPVTFTMDVTHPNNDFANGVNYLSTVSMGLITNNLAYQTTHTAAFTEPVLRGFGSSYIHLGFRVTNLNNFPNVQYAAANTTTAPYWGPTATSGDLANATGSGTLLGIGSQTFVSQLDNKTLRIRFVIRVGDNFTTWALNGGRQVHTYGMATINVGGVEYSQDVTSTTPLNYRKYDTWETDMISPTVSVAGPSDYNTAVPPAWQINWGVTDNFPSNFRQILGTCKITGNNFRVTQLTTLSTIFNLNDGAETLCAHNAAINMNNPNVYGLKQYTWVTQNGSTNYDYALFEAKLSTQDYACNSPSAISTRSAAGPWMISRRGAASAKAGWTGFQIPEVNMNALWGSSWGNEAFLAYGAAISGNTNITGNRQSANQTYTTNYTDLNTNPANIIGLNTWYDTITKIINDRFPGQITNVALDTSPVNLNSYGTTANKYYLRFNPPSGTLTVPNAFNCTRNGIIFVNGNLIINPNMTNTNPYLCVWVVKGNVTINTGTNFNPTSGGTISGIDTIQGNAIITDGTFNVLPDPATTTSYGDPFAGSILTANTLSLGRNLGTWNATYPSESFVYDPSFISVWGRELSVNKFSIRPK